MFSYSYVTVLSTSSYLKGLLALNESLKKTSPRYPFYALLSPDISSEIENTIYSFGIMTLRINDSLNHLFQEDGINSNHPHWSHTFDKLFVFNLIRFEKVVFLDTDMLILENIDELFDCEHMSAVSAGSSYPGNESWRGQLNSGLMVIKPSSVEYEGLLATIPTVIAQKNEVSDQDVIKYYYRDIWHKNLWLDEGYNMFANYVDWYIYNLNYQLKKSVLSSKKRKNIKVIHFIGYPKPWMKRISSIGIFKMEIKTLAYRLLGKRVMRRVALVTYYRILLKFSLIK